MDRNWNVELTPAGRSASASRCPGTATAASWSRPLVGFLAALVAGAVAVNRHLRSARQLRRRRTPGRGTHPANCAGPPTSLAHGQKMTALGTLAAGIAHDFNNILSIIKGSAQIIAAHPQDRDKVLTRVSRAS